jgi:DNA/RNA endonuclease YhcR with UshA esterase domain
MIEGRPDDALCPSCNRFVGTYSRCMYCGARVHKRLSIRVAKWAAVVISVAGLVVLWSVARLSEVETIRVADVNETMNFALIRIQGEVLRDPKVTFAKDQHGENTARVRIIGFPLHDGSGEIQILAFESIAKRLWEERATLLPRQGDRVDLVGSLRVRNEDGEMKLGIFLQSLKNLTVERGAVPTLTLEEINESRVGQVVSVTAAVAGVDRLGKGPYQITLADGSGAQKLTAWENTFLAIQDHDTLQGRTVKARVRVTLYREKSLQLFLDQPWDLEFTEHPDAAAWVARAASTVPRRARAPEPEAQGPGLCVAGTISKVSPLGKGKGLLVHVEGDERPVVVWKTTLEEKSEWKELLVPGGRIRACGAPAEYKGKPQVKVTLKGSIEALGAGR